MKKCLVLVVLAAVLACGAVAGLGGCANMNAQAWRAEAEALKQQLTFTQIELMKVRKAYAQEVATNGEATAETLATMKKLEDTVGALSAAIGQFTSGATAIEEGATGGQKLAGALQIGLGLLGVIGAVFGVKERIAKTGADKMLGAVIAGVEHANDAATKKEISKSAKSADVLTALHAVVKART